MNNPEQINNNFEKIKKSLKDFGGAFYLLGWIGLIGGGIFLILSIFNNFSVSFSGYGISDFVLIIVESLILIILAGRIKNNVLDKNNKKYIFIILIIYIFNTILRFVALESGGGFTVVLIVIYIITTLVSLNKALKDEEFKNILESPKHSITKRNWVTFGVISFLILCFAIYFDFNYNTALWADEDFIDNEEFIEMAISEMKEDLPMVVDETSTLEEVYGKNNMIYYRFKLAEEYMISEEFIDLMKEDIMGNICDTEGLEMFFNRGISIKYIYGDYFDNEDSIIVKPEDCLK
ncbi:MAG: hypothetical protein ACOX0B_01180 [Minisyncoccales bacterium]|jgi:hypothetical protein